MIKVQEFSNELYISFLHKYLKYYYQLQLWNHIQKIHILNLLLCQDLLSCFNTFLRFLVKKK